MLRYAHYQNLTYRLPFIYIDPQGPGEPELPGCVGDASTFNAGYGKCNTYGANHTPTSNHAYCPTDSSGGHYAHQVCEECGKCVASGTLKSAVNTKTKNIKFFS